MNNDKSDHIAPLFQSTHWCPFPQRIEYKINALCYWAIQRSWFARVNALCNISRNMLQEVAAHFRADF